MSTSAPFTPVELMQLRDALIAPVREAAGLVEEVRLAGADVRHKADKSPVTLADERAEAFLSAVILQLTPHIPIIGEEAATGGTVTQMSGQENAPFWLLDPVDGTREFIAGGADYTVNVALVVRRQPVLGLVCTPRDGRLWAGGPDLPSMRSDTGLPPVLCADLPRPALGAELRVVASRSHRDAQTQALLDQLGQADIVARGSSVKFCALADGDADFYPRFGPTCEWDTAAGHAVLLGAGGQVTGLDWGGFAYAKPTYLNPGFFALSASVSVADIRSRLSSS